jgi:hypothetical protein
MRAMGILWEHWVSQDVLASNVGPHIAQGRTLLMLVLTSPVRPPWCYGYHATAFDASLWSMPIGTFSPNQALKLASPSLCCPVVLKPTVCRPAFAINFIRTGVHRSKQAIDCIISLTRKTTMSCIQFNPDDCSERSHAGGGNSTLEFWNQSFFDPRL